MNPPPDGTDLRNALELALTFHDEAMADEVTAIAAFGVAVRIIQELTHVNLRTACLVVESALLARELNQAGPPKPSSLKPLVKK
jgi:hypothetical protein